MRLLLALSPRWLFLYPGCGLLAAGAVALLVPVLRPVDLGGRFGAYTMLFGSALVVCGAQATWFHLLARAFCENAGLTAARAMVGFRQRHVLEYSLAGGLALLLAGASGSLWSLSAWAEGVGLEARLRIAVPAVTLSILGAQSMFSGFLLWLLTTQAERP